MTVAGNFNHFEKTKPWFKQGDFCGLGIHRVDLEVLLIVKKLILRYVVGNTQPLLITIIR